MVFSLADQPMSTEFIADEMLLRRLTPNREITTDSDRVKK